MSTGLGCFILLVAIAIWSFILWAAITDQSWLNYAVIGWLGWSMASFLVRVGAQMNKNSVGTSRGFFQ